MRNILFTVLFIGILSLIASPISLASKSLHKANMMGDAGDRLSGGERQRITIARAMLKPSSVVILDEATAYALSLIHI